MLKPKIKAVFFDIDGTLLSFKTHTIPASTERALEKLKSLDIKVLVSTGRSINSLDHIKYLDFDGFITFNGGYCVTDSGSILHRKAMDAGDIQRIIAYSQETPLSFSFMSERDITISLVTPEIEAMYRGLNLQTPSLMDPDLVDPTAVLQTNLFIAPELENAFMQRVMPNSVATRWTPAFADINPQGQSKKVGVDIFCTHFGIDRCETMAFGDGGNDIEMLKHVEVGIAMGNANPEVKAIADFVTTDVDQDGIRVGLETYAVI